MDIKTITGKTPVFKQSFKEMITEAAPSWDKEYMEGHTYADVYRVVYAASKDGTVNIDKTSFTGNELTGIPKSDLLAVVRNRFEKWGLTSKVNMGVYSITTFGISEGKKLGPLSGKATSSETAVTPEGTEEDEANLAAGVADISKLKQKIFKIPNVSSGSKFTTQMGIILTHMESFAAGLSKTTLMITSDPGTGKTSAIKALSTLTGIPLLIIEAPSIVSETIINIPYLVIDGPKTREGNVEVESSSMSIVQAESNIITQIKSMEQRDPDFIEKQIQRNPQLKAVAEHLSYELQAIKGKYKCILFIDEYFRTSNVKIRNILRNILNGSLGNSAIPKGVYIIMSSNVDDSGVSDIPLNQDFHMIKQDKPEAEDFMSFMYSKYVQPEAQVQTDPVTGEPIEVAEPSQDVTDTERPDTGPGMQPEVFNAFYEEIKNANMSVQDDNVDVRTSPRRLEQIMIYINACIPVSSIEEIEKIKGFIKVNLMNYETLEISSEITKYDAILKKIIEQTSPEFAKEYDTIQPIDSSSWKNSLQQQLEVKEKIGEERSYIPILSGAPGIGKTSQCAAVAKDLGKGYIHIDVSTINSEDAVGIPIPQTDANGKITTKFSEPNLYRVIMNKYDEIIELYKKPGRKYNIILLFDELNRTTVPVFNALRAVLLTKSFGPSYKLPSDIMMVGAINPSDAGAITLTGHMKDVVDIIPSTANYTETMEYIKSIKELDSIEEELGFDVTESLVEIVDSLVNTFKSEFNTAGDPLERSQRPFFWTTGADVFYISPREMTEMIKLAAISIKKELFKNLKYSKDLTYTEDQYSEIQKACVNVTASSFELTFNNILTKQKLDADIAKMITAKIVSSDVILGTFNTIAMKKSVHEASLDSIFVQYKNDVNALDSGVIGQYLTYGTVTSFGQDIQEILYLINMSQSNMDLVKSVIQLDKVLLKSLERVQANFSFAEVVKTQTRGFIKGFLTNYKASSTLEYFDFLNSPELNSLLKEMQARHES